MNKQKLASKIWEAANKMRSKIEASEYKDYILGFIFYKFLSENEIKKLKEAGWEDTDITAENLNEDDEETVNDIRHKMGYFISYNNLFSTWLKKGINLDISDVRDALSAFDRLIDNSHKKVFVGIFNTLETGLANLGTTAKEQTRAVTDLIQLIQEIPMDGKQDYDVLGFVYRSFSRRCLRPS